MRVGETAALSDKSIEMGSGNLVVRIMSLNVAHAKIVCQNHDDVGPIGWLRCRFAVDLDLICTLALSADWLRRGECQRENGDGRHADQRRL